MRNTRTMSETARLVTAEELEHFPSDDNRFELVEGRLIPMSPVSFEHGRVVLRIGFLLARYLEDRPVGAVVAEVGFTLARNPDTVRAPDIAFIRTDRVPARDARGFFEGPPDVAIEVLSPDDREAEIREKVAEYLARGAPLVVVIDPEDRIVTTFQPNGPQVILRKADDLLDLSDVIPGFSCRLREIFE
jgi:Uma2 family endonuclease